MTNKTSNDQSERSRTSIDSFGTTNTYAPSGVDLSLLRERLKMTVTERWERNFEAMKLVGAFREAGRAQCKERSSR